ncbi:hypothetical protein CR513_39515, partial [Mucuna pruriens]
MGFSKQARQRWESHNKQSKISSPRGKVYTNYFRKEANKNFIIIQIYVNDIIFLVLLMKRNKKIKGSISINKKVQDGRIKSFKYPLYIRLLPCLCARFQYDPREYHLKFVKRIFRYLVGITNKS